MHFTLPRNTLFAGLQPVQCSPTLQLVVMHETSTICSVWTREYAQVQKSQQWSLFLTRCIYMYIDTCSWCYVYSVMYIVVGDLCCMHVQCGCTCMVSCDSGLWNAECTCTYVLLCDDIQYTCKYKCVSYRPMGCYFLVFPPYNLVTLLYTHKTMQCTCLCTCKWKLASNAVWTFDVCMAESVGSHVP